MYISRRGLLGSLAAGAGIASARKARALSRLNRLLLFNSPQSFAGATLDLNFASQRYFIQGQGNSLSPLSFTRASVATELDAGGNYVSFASGLPRILPGVGYLPGQTRTNSIPNNSMQGAISGTLGSGGAFPTGWQNQAQAGASVAVTVVGTGVEDGIDYIDVNYAGTANGSFGDIIFNQYGDIPSAGAGKTWTGSFFVKVVGGSLTNINLTKIQVQELTGSGFHNQGIGTYTIAGASTPLSQCRQTLTYTTTNSLSDNVDLLFLFNTNVAAINVTFRIGWPQMEPASYVTSPIRTTAAAATRAADVLTLPRLNGWYGQDQTGTLFVKGYIPALNAEANYLLALENAANSHRLALTISATNTINFFDQDSNTVLSSGAPSAGAVFKVAAAFAPGAQSVCLNGGTVQKATAAALTTGISRLAIGNSLGVQQPTLSEYEIAYWPTKQSDAFLQYITSNS